MKIFLLGMPGSGKSTLGKALATILQLPFVDLDAEIESKTRTPITRIFHERGEATFREHEREALASWLDREDSFIMATGGGTPCFHDNLSRMKAAGLTVFVEVPLEVLVQRMNQDSKGTRPLLGDQPEAVSERLASLLSGREEIYHLAHLTVDGLKPAEQIADLIKGHIKG